jgi:hypothetical protein
MIEVRLLACLSMLLPCAFVHAQSSAVTEARTMSAPSSDQARLRISCAANSASECRFLVIREADIVDNRPGETRVVIGTPRMLVGACVADGKGNCAPMLARPGQEVSVEHSRK